MIRLLTCVVAPLIAPLAGAQQPHFLTEPLSPNGPPGGADAVAAGDLDGDGDVDVVVGIRGGQNRLLLNDGSGAFTDATSARLPAASDWTSDLSLGDVDGDGDLDIVVGNTGTNLRGEQNRLYVNDGKGRFLDATRTNLPILVAASFRVALGDVDGDGDADLIVGNYSSRDRLLVNDGRGVFRDATANRMPPDSDLTRDLAVADLDGDGDLDVVRASGAYSPVGRQGRLLLNAGRGTFVDATATHARFAPAVSMAVAAGDVDADGDIDVVLGNWGPDVLYLNDGRGRLSRAAFPSPSNQTNDVILVDVDGDGDLDVMTANGRFRDLYAYAGQHNRLYSHDGKGRFVDITRTWMPRLQDPNWALTAADVDGDGDPDFIEADASYAALHHRLQRNLLRQLVAATPLRIGRTYSLDIHARNGAPSLVDVAQPFLSTGQANIRLPGIGRLGIDPGRAVALRPVVIPPSTGVIRTGFAVPDRPGLIGTALFGQAAVLRYPRPLRLTNVTADRVAR